MSFLNLMIVQLEGIYVKLQNLVVTKVIARKHFRAGVLMTGTI